MSETPAEYNAKIIAEFRAHKGRVGGMWEGTPLLLLHHTGAKSGVSRVNPVAYLPDDRRYLIWAANGGARSDPDWYHNLKAHPNLRVEVGSETIDVVAEEATGAERERLFEKAAERYPQLSELARKTNRVIPVLILTPHGDRVRPPEPGVSDQTEAPVVVDRPTFQAGVDAVRAREKAHTRAGDAIAAARRRLPMTKVDSSLTLIGPEGPVTLLDAFEGRRQLIAYYHMWYAGQPAEEQCEGCTFFNGQVRELSYLHFRHVTYATFCQGPYQESVRYRDFMGWTMPWYSVEDSAEALLAGRRVNRFYLVCYLRRGDRVFETYWTNGRGVEAMDNSYGLLDLTVYGRQQTWEDSPAGWPQLRELMRSNGRPTAQWSRLHAGRSDDLATAPDQPPAHTESQ